MAVTSLILGYPNRADGATFSSGGWEASLPVGNMSDRELPKVSRSTDATLANTKFQVDLSENKNLTAFALLNHNLSSTAQWKVTLGTTAGASDIYDTGFVNVWQIVFGDLVEWESVTWWLGVAGDEYLRSPYPALAVLDDVYSARYITVEISDAANADGYVQVGRFFAGNKIQPACNMEYGLQDRWNDLSIIDASESGSVWANEKRKVRSASFVLGKISLANAGYLHEMQRMVGTTQEVLYIPYPDDMGESQRYGFLGRLSELSAIEYPYHNNRSLALNIRELT